MIECGDGQHDVGEIAAREVGQEIQIACHARTLGDNAYGVIESRQHLEHITRDPVVLLYGLIGVGVGADGDNATILPRLAQSRCEQSARVRLGEEAGPKIEPRRKTEKRAGGPRETKEAAMPAAAIRTDRTFKENVW